MYGMKGNKNPATRPEVRKKKSELQKGKPHPHKGVPRFPETRKKISLGRIGKCTKEKHWNWQGGKSFEIYPEKFWRMRKAIRERDDYTCQICGKYPAFEVHHIDYNNKKNCEPENLITLCRSCNVKVNKNRNYWTNYFRNFRKCQSQTL